MIEIVSARSLMNSRYKLTDLPSSFRYRSDNWAGRARVRVRVRVRLETVLTKCDFCFVTEIK